MRFASLVLFAACSAPAREQPAATGPTAPQGAIHAVALPGGGPDGIVMDYLLYDARTNTVWAPAGNTGSVDVIDVASGKLSRIAGFPTKEIDRHGKKQMVGPSSAT